VEAADGHDVLVVDLAGDFVVRRDTEQLVEHDFGLDTCELRADAEVHSHPEAEMAGQLNLAPGPLARAYEYWVRRLADKEGRGKSDTSVRAAEAAARKPNPGAAAPVRKSGAKAKAKPQAKGKKR